MEEQSQPVAKVSFAKKVWLVSIALLLIGGLAVGGLLVWKAKQPRSLLPATIGAKIVSFTPYFYFDKIPTGYSLDEEHISFDGDVLLMPLTKPGNPTIVLTEQPLPNNLPQDLMQNGDQVNGTVGAATINKIQERLVGTIITSDVPRTLILLSTSDTNTAELIALLQGLRLAP